MRVNKYGQSIKQLEANWLDSQRSLIADGFQLTCTVLAGLESGSNWIHPDGDTAEVTLRNGNLPKYSNWKAVLTRRLGPEMAEKIMKACEEL